MLVTNNTATAIHLPGLTIGASAVGVVVDDKHYKSDEGFRHRLHELANDGTIAVTDDNSIGYPIATAAETETAEGGEQHSGQLIVAKLVKSGTLSVAAGTDSFVCPVKATIVDVYTNVTTAPTVSASVTVDVNKNGTTVFTDQTKRPAIAFGTTKAGPARPAVTALAPGDVLSADVDIVGGTGAGADLSVTVLLRAA